jgi:hypothetical protein
MAPDSCKAMQWNATGTKSCKVLHNTILTHAFLLKYSLSLSRFFKGLSSQDDPETESILNTLN